MKVAVITGFLGELRDRFCRYNQPRSIGEKLELASRIGGVSGVEVIYPYDFETPEATEAEIQRLGLGVAAVNVNVKSEPEFASGALSSPDPGVRRKAVEFLTQGMDTAHRLGCDRVTVCPLSDGHDYPFLTDYREAWGLMVDSVGTAASHRQDVMLSVEYKPYEPRVRSALGGAYRSVLLLKEIGLGNLGVTVDVGHSLYGGENPAEVLAMLCHYGIRPYIHLNDNCRNWDWDLMPGAVNLWDLTEFVWTALQCGYDDWFTLDVFPSRMDPASCFDVSAKMLQSMAEAAARIDRRELQAMRSELGEGMSAPAVMEYVWERAGVWRTRGTARPGGGGD